MSETLQPRQVDKPFLARWVRTTFALLAGSPTTFGAAIALLATFDVVGSDVLPARLLYAGFTIVVGALLLPVFWILLSLLSRQSDRAFGRSDLLRYVAYRGVWVGGLLTGCLLASASWLLHRALSANPVLADYAGSCTWNCLLLVAPLGVCFFPLIALAPGLTVIEAFQLSKKASRLNGEWMILVFVGALSLAADGIARALPAGAIVTAAILVFIGIFNYVAYRDIFERRADYATESVLAAARPRRQRRLARAPFP